MVLSLHPSASAFGKVILVGEHSVVYGFPALAAGLPDALHLSASPLDNSRAPIELAIPSWQLELELSPDNDHPVARACLEVLSMCDGPITGWRIHGRTELPARAGLGSSAALTVAVARLALGPQSETERVIEASLAGERVFHGTPSGIDNEVAARGGLLRYVRGETAEQIALPQRLNLCIVPSGIPRNTADQVANVRCRNDRFPTVTRPLLESLGAACAAATDALLSNDLNKLGEIMDVTHATLAALGVSSPILDELCCVARTHGAYGAKLTGAGGGGCILIVPPPDPTRLQDAFCLRGLRPLNVSIES